MAVDDKFGYHELLHTAHIMTYMWNDYIEEHSLLETNPKLKAEAERIGFEIGKFYQMVALESDKKLRMGNERKRK